MPKDNCGDDRGQLARNPLRVGPIFTRFSSQEIPDACLNHLIELARLAPSEWNFQPWRWIVVRSEPGKRQLDSSIYLPVPLGSAPVVLICLTDTYAWKTAPQRLQEMVASEKMTQEQANEVLGKIREYYSASPEIARRAALASAFVALHQMLLAAADCELSAYWVTEFNEQKIKDFFHIPDSFLVAALMAIGYRDGSMPPPAPKLPLVSLVYKEKFGEGHDQS
jgi:nitroreductase